MKLAVTCFAFTVGVLIYAEWGLFKSHSLSDAIIFNVFIVGFVLASVLVILGINPFGKSKVSA